MPRPSAETVRRALIWASAALATYLLLRAILPTRPASTPLVATAGAMMLAAVAYTMRRRLFARSTAFALVGLVAWLVAWNRGAPMLYAFSAGCFAIVLVSHLLPHWVLRRIEGRIEAPAWVSHGDRAEVHVTATNPATSTMRMLEIDVPIGGVAPPDDRARAIVAQLPPGESRRLRARTPPMRRGRRFVGPLYIRTGFPLGLAFAELGVPHTGQHVWVYPRLFQVQFVPIAGEQFLDHGGTESSRSGGVEEFAGVREYRHGDSRRHVHWRASARRGELVVKEFTRRSAATVTIAVDMRASVEYGEGHDTSIEAALSAAASIARHALDHGHHVQLILGGEQLQKHGPFRGEAGLEPILRVLALAEAGGLTQPGTWLPGVAAFAPPESTVVLVFIDRDIGPLGGLARLEARGILVVPVPINAESYGAAPAPADKLPARARARTLRRGEDFAAVFRK